MASMPIGRGLSEESLGRSTILCGDPCLVKKFGVTVSKKLRIHARVGKYVYMRPICPIIYGCVVAVDCSRHDYPA